MWSFLGPVISGMLALFAMVCLMFLVGSVIGPAVASPVTKVTPVSALSGPEQVEMFTAGNGADGPAELKQKVDKWFKDHDGKVEITGRTQSGDRYTTTITIWYRPRTD